MRGPVSEQERWFYAFVIAFIASGSASLLLPLFAATVLGGTVGQIGLMASLASLAGVPFSILWGRWSDRLERRKPFVLLAFVGTGMALLAMGFVREMRHLILLNMAMNAAWVASSAVSTLLVIEGVEQSKWESRIGRFNRYTGAGWVSGLALGAVWNSLAGRLPEGGLRELFHLLAVLDLLAASMAFRWLREPERVPRYKRRRFRGLIVEWGDMLVERFRYAPFHLYHLAQPGRLLELIRGKEKLSPQLARYLSCVILIFMGFSAFFVPLPVFFRKVLGLSNSLIYAVWMTHPFVAALFHSRAGDLAERFGNRRIQRLALSIRIALFPLAGFLPLLPPGARLPLIVGMFVLTGMSWAMTNVTCQGIVAKLAPEGSRGQVLGLYNALLGVGWILGSLLGGYLANWLGYLAAFSAAAALLLAALVGIARLHLQPWPQPSPGERPAPAASTAPRPPARA